MATNSNQPNISSKDDEISLKEIILKVQEWWGYLLSKWRFILIVGILGGILGFVYALVNKPIYTATTTFVLEEEGGGSALGRYAGIASMMGVDLGVGGGGIFQGDNIFELYKSRTMIEKALLSEIEYQGKKQLLIDRYIDINDLRERWSENPQLADLKFKLQGDQQFNRLQDSILGRIADNIKKNYLDVSKPDNKLSIIEVKVQAKDEAFAKTFNNEIVKNVNDFYVQTKTKKSLENLAILQHQADSVKAVLEGAIYSTAATLDATPNLNPTRQVLRTSVQRAQFSAEANRTILMELIKNMEVAKIALRKETPLIQVIDHPILPLKKEKMGTLKGIIMGGCLFVFLTVLWLLINKIYKEIMGDGNDSGYENIGSIRI